MWKQFFTIGFSFFISVGVLSQDISQTLQLADHFRETGLHDMAVSHYRRVIFFGYDSLQAIAFPLIAECQLKSGNHEEAIFFFQLAYNTAPSDSLKNEYILNRVLCYILIDRIEMARQQLYALSDTSGHYFRKKFHFYHGIIDLFSFQPEKAKHHFLLSSGDEAEKERIEFLFTSMRLHHPTPSTAKWLSIFMPGAGQAYAGDMRGAINSFLLNAGLAGLALHTAFNYSFWEGAISIMPWLIRYYMGGHRHAETRALNRQKEKQRELLQLILVAKQP